MSTLRIALCGCGWIASRHAAALARQPDVQVVGVCSRDPGHAAAFAREHAPAARPFGDFPAMLDAVRPDAVYLAIPPHAHRGQAELAAGRGIHLFLEKPIALDAERARAITGAVRRAGVVSQVGYHMRHGAAVRRLRAMIADGSAGRPTLFQASYHCNALHAAWWRDRALSGGQVCEQVIHLYDLACHLLGDPVAAWGQMDNLCHQQVEGYTAEDTSVGMLRHANGALSAITGSNCAIPDEWTSRVSVVCGRVTVHFADPDHAEFTHTGAGGGRCEPVGGGGDLYAAATADFLQAIRAGGRACAPVEDGLRSLETVLAVAASARDGGRPALLHAPWN